VLSPDFNRSVAVTRENLRFAGVLSVKPEKSAMYGFTKCFPATVMLILITAAHAQTPDQFRAFDKKWADATTHGDLSALADILSDDLTYTHSSGKTQSKAQFIASIRSKELQYHSIEFESADVRDYGNVAIISSHIRVKVTADGHDINVHTCFLHIWVKQGGRWQLVAHQATKLD
jgi:ketosteroid isomerase-like protein